MTSTTYYNLNIVEGTDIVNPLIIDNPNYEKIDEAMHNSAVAGVTIATEIANATVHAITRENSDCAVIRFIATSVWKAGDTATVDGVPVTALLPSGETLPDGAYVINANVLCILTGTNLTIYAERKKAENANEIAFNDTTVGAELVRLDNEIDNVNSNLPVKISTTFPATKGISTKVCDYPNGFSVNNTFLQCFRFKYGSSQNWYLYIPYFSSVLSFNISLNPDGIYVYIDGSEVNNFLGKDLELYLIK